VSEADPDNSPRALYIPAGNRLVSTLTAYCLAARLSNVAVSGIGSIADVWVLLNPNGASMCATSLVPGPVR